MKKKFMSLICSIITTPCIIYYVSKFYIDKELHFFNNNLFGFSIIAGLLLIALIRLVYVENKLDRAIDSIERLEEIVTQNHYEQIKHNNNTRRIIIENSNTEDK